MSVIFQIDLHLTRLTISFCTSLHRLDDVDSSRSNEIRMERRGRRFQGDILGGVQHMDIWIELIPSCIWTERQRQLNLHRIELAVILVFN